MTATVLSMCRPMCMANRCDNDATYDLETWPLCRRCRAIKADIEKRWGPREHAHAEGTHARKEILGGEDS